MALTARGGKGDKKKKCHSELKSHPSKKKKKTSVITAEPERQREAGRKRNQKMKHEEEQWGEMKGMFPGEDM